MKKIFSLLLLSLTLSFSASTVYAQLPPNSIGADFTMTDYLGNSHHLYSYLDAGKPVIMDISAVWCSPCWTYHNSGALEDLYASYGPTGTNELMVLWIEGDEGTLAQLQGGTGSVGNWTTGTAFPMILTVAPNTTQVVSDYEIGYFPTVYVICPDRVVNLVGQVPAASLKAACDACPDLPTTTNDVKLYNVINPSTSYCVTTVTPKVTIQNYGTAALTTLTITSKIDGAVVGTYNWSGNLARFEAADVTLPAINGLSDGTHTFTAECSMPNGVADQDATNDAASSSFAVFSTGANVLVKVTTDSYPSEVSWDIFQQGTTNLVASLDRLNAGVNNTYVCLDYACYTFKIYDAYGDGMGSTGKVLITFAGDTLAYFLGNTYTSVKSVNFCVSGSNIGENAAISSLNVYPNPFTTNTNIAVSLSEPQDVAINVYNMMGQIVYTVPMTNLSAGEHLFELNGENLAKGMYIVRMNVGDQVLNSQIELSR